MDNNDLLRLPDVIETDNSNHWLFWILRLTVLGLVVWFQPDGIIAVLTGLGWSFWATFVVVAIYANFQLIYYFNFAKWISTEVVIMTLRSIKANEEFQQDLGFVEKIESDLKTKGILSKANKDYIARRFHEFIQKEHRKIEIAKNGSLISTFGLAATPLPGARSLPALFFGVIRVRQGLYALMAGNTIRIFYMTGVWAMLKRFLSPNFKFALISFFVLGSLVFVCRQISPSHLEKKQSPK